MQVQQVQTDRLKPWADNPRVNEHAVDAVARSISNFGFNMPILCDQDLTIVAGHTRWKAAKKIGIPSVPVIVLEMTDGQPRAGSYIVRSGRAREANLPVCTPWPGVSRQS
jgi:site-specific DNA-methyltransferase (adenine-specific)